MTGSSRAEIVVDLAAIRHNVRALKHRTDAALIAVVKADGYGHGMLPVARAALEGGADWLGAATIDEALALRAEFPDAKLLCWLTVPEDLYDDAIRADIDVTAYTLEELAEIAKDARAEGKPARVQLKVDTGLSRGGARPDAWQELFDHARDGERQGWWRITGLWSHFANADEPSHPANDQQEQRFREAIALADAAGLAPEIRHLANSAATVLRPSSHFDAVRCGIAIYGLDPAPGETTDLDLRPAMTVQARLAMVKQLDAGDSVSYGHTWTASTPTRVGLVPAGYGEGVPRHAGNTASVSVAGHRSPIRGRICMDQFLVDLGDQPAQAGDLVVLFGEPIDEQPTAQDWAEACDTINYEIVTRIGGRLSRRYVDTEAANGR